MCWSQGISVQIGHHPNPSHPQPRQDSWSWHAVDVQRLKHQRREKQGSFVSFQGCWSKTKSERNERNSDESCQQRYYNITVYIRTYMYHMYIHILGNLLFWPLTSSFWPLTLSFWPLTLSFWPLTLSMHMQKYIPIQKKQLSGWIALFHQPPIIFFIPTERLSIPLHLLASPNQKFHKKNGSCLRSLITKIEKIRPNKNASKPRQRIIIQSWPTWILLFWGTKQMIYATAKQDEQRKHHPLGVLKGLFQKYRPASLGCWWMMLAVPSCYIYVRWNNTHTGIMWLVVISASTVKPFLEMAIPSNLTR